MQLAKGMPYPALAPAVSRPGLTQRWLPLGTLLAFPAEGDHRRGADGDPVPRDFSVDGFPPRGEPLDQEVCHRRRQESKEDPSHCRHRNPFCTYSPRTVIRWVLASQRQDQTDSTKHARDCYGYSMGAVVAWRTGCRLQTVCQEKTEKGKAPQRCAILI